MEKHEMKMKWILEMETKLETEMETELLNCYSSSKIGIDLLAFAPRHPRALPTSSLLITCFTSLASFLDLCHLKYFCIG